MVLDTQFTYTAVAVVVAVSAAVYDIRSRRIPNLLVGPAFLLGLLLHLCLNGASGLLHSLAAGVCGGFVFLIFYVLGGMGAGDVKLVAAVCAIAGWPNVPLILVLTCLAGGVMGIVVAARHGRLKQTLRNVLGLTAHHMKHGAMPHPELNVRNGEMLRLPYGVAIAAGVILTLCLHNAQG